MRDKIIEILDENYDASYPLDSYVAGKLLELFSEQEHEIKELKALLKELIDLAERNNFSVPYYFKQALKK